MGLISSTASITRYRVEGELEGPVMETIRQGLTRNSIIDIDEEATEKAVGWTSFDNPFHPAFDGDSFIIGEYLLFSLRIDKKSIPAKIVKKYITAETAKKLAETDRDALSRSEKQAIKEVVLSRLSLRIPATPNTYDLLWQVEEGRLWFFSTQKSANEELETLFAKSFKINLTRLFPFTTAELLLGLSEAEKEKLASLSPGRFISE